MPFRSAAMSLLVVSGLTLVASPRVAAQEPKQSAEQRLDGRIGKGITEAVGVGVELYNAGDQAGCYRLYEGVVRAITPVLEHRPKLQGSLRKALTTAATQPNVGDRAFTLRGALDETIKALWQDTPSPSLFTRLGGEPAVKAVVDDFLTRTLANPKVNFSRKGTADEWEASEAAVTRLKSLVTALVVEVTGGPKGYAGRDMKTTHKGMKITDAEFDAMAGDLKATLDKFKVPAAEQKELFAIIGSTRKDIVELVAPSLFTRLGGEPAVKAVVDDFLTRTLANPKVNFSRKGTADEWEANEAAVTRLKSLVTALVVEVTGGPKGYAGRDMKTTHKGMKITDAEFDAMAGDLKATLDKFKVPAAEQAELFAIIGSTRKDIVEVEKK